MRTIAVMQPYFFPYIGYWQLMNAVDVYVVFDDVNYINRGWITRNRILINGEPHFFNLPVLGASQNKLIRDIRVNSDAKGIAKLLRTVEMAYGRAPFFGAAFDVFERVMKNCTEGKSVSQFLYESFEIIGDHLGISTRLVMSSDIPKDASLKGEEKILAICEAIGAERYINAIGGMELYSADRFSERGIDLRFLRTCEITYRQFGGDHVPWLSILDVMMFCSRETVREMLGMWSLV